MPRTFHLSLVIATAAVAAFVHNEVRAQACPVNVPHVTGTWVVLPYQMPINPISASLLPDGKVLIVAGSESDAKNHSGTAQSYRGAVWDPTGTTQASVTVKNLTYDVFCSGTASLPDGRQLIVGGTASYGFTGDRRASIFDPVTEAFMQSQNMANGRWYATATTLGDGRIMAMSGLTSAGVASTTIEIYDLKNAGAGWNTPTNVPFTPPLFPRLALLPDGTVFYTGQGSGGAFNANSWIFNPANGAWTMSVRTTRDRTYGSAVILPLLPPNYTPRVMNFGGGSHATSTTEIIDLSSSNPSWSPGPNMSTGRIQMNAVILPNGNVLAEGGSVNNEAPDTPGKTADLYDPASNAMHSGGTAAYSRLYHSTALLLPDATVVSMGSNPPPRGSYEAAIEIYTPPYLFDANDHLITSGRPSITSISPASAMVGYNSLLAVNYTSTSAITSAVLVRSGSVTHAFDMEQRLVGLCGPPPQQPNCSGAGGVINLTTPPNSNVAPPGHYMLFLLDSAGVPSKAAFIQLTPYTTTAPTGTISSPSSDVKIRAGGAVAFSTSSTAAQYSWVFPGGSPATSTAQNPGTVTFATAGTYQASLTLIDSSGNSDPNPPTRQITVNPVTANFSIAVSPSAQQVFPGGAASYTVTVTPVSGFTGSVSLSVGSENGFPSGITSAGFSPASIAGSGSSTLTMNTTSSTVPWALSLTISGTSGTIFHTASTTLLVNLAPPASLSATPGDSQVSLAWPASVGATSYDVQRSDVSNGPYERIACPAGTSYLDTGLTNGTAYYYVVSGAFSGSPVAGGESANSSEATAMPQGAPPTPPAPPTNLTAKATKHGPINLQWVQSITAGVTQNSIYRRTSGTNYPSTPLATIDAITSNHDNSAADTTTYCYVVTARDAAAQSAYSNESCVTTH